MPYSKTAASGLRVELLHRDAAAGLHTGAHAHAEGQLFAVRRGLLVLHTESARWALPRGCLGWIPPQRPHAAFGWQATAGWSLYAEPGLCHAMPSAPQAYAADGLAQALVERLLGLAGDAQAWARLERLASVLFHELAHGRCAPLCLPMPRDRRLLALAQDLLADPSSRSGLDDWSRRSGIPRRTLSRRFEQETGLSPGRWQQQARLLQALQWLAEARPVKWVASSVGYDSTGAFIEAFGRSFGVTPGRFFETQGGPELQSL